jgi:hypothetical protein
VTSWEELKATTGGKFIFVVVENFSKWIETKVICSMTKQVFVNV